MLKFIKLWKLNREIKEVVRLRNIALDLNNVFFAKIRAANSDEEIKKIQRQQKDNLNGYQKLCEEEEILQYKRILIADWKKYA